MKTMGPTEAGSLLTAILKERRRFLAVAVQRVGDREAAKDVLQVALLRALEHATTVRDPDRILSWFGRVVSNTAVDYVRHRDAYHRAVERLASQRPMDQTTVEEGEASVCPCVRTVVSSLGPTHAAVLRRIDLEDRSLEGVAHDDQVTVNNTRVRLHRARRALRDRLVERCGGSPLERCLPCGCHRQSRRGEVAQPPSRRIGHGGS